MNEPFIKTIESNGEDYLVFTTSGLAFPFPAENDVDNFVEDMESFYTAGKFNNTFVQYTEDELEEFYSKPVETIYINHTL